MSDVESGVPTEVETLQAIGRELQAANQRLETIKNCLVFLVVVTIVSIGLSIAVLAQAD